MEERTKVLYVSRIKEEKRAENLGRILSDYGTQLRMNRSIQAEGTFAVVKEDICFDNPIKFIIASDYANKCALQKKRDEERAFSKKELESIRQDCMMHLKDSFALMTLASSYSGLRAWELPVLRKSDDLGDFLHVHRQQRKEKDENGHQFFYELPHTKDERRHPHNGRLVQITPELREILDHANNLPGKSEYTFHNKKGEPLLADSYEQNLRRLLRAKSPS